MSELSSLSVQGWADLAGRALPAGLRHASGGLKAAPDGAKAAVRAAKDFEAIFLHKLLKEMKDTIPDGGLLGDGISDQVKDIFWYYLAEDLADKGGLGLWKEIYRQTAPETPAEPTVEHVR